MIADVCNQSDAPSWVMPLGVLGLIALVMAVSQWVQDSSLSGLNRTPHGFKRSPIKPLTMVNKANVPV